MLILAKFGHLESCFHPIKAHFVLILFLVKTLIATKSEHLTFANTGKERTARKLNRIRIAMMD